MKILRLIVLVTVLSLTGCASRNSKDESVPSTPVLMQTEFDVFNLRWGCSKEFVEKNCDFGGKKAENFGPIFDYKIIFSKKDVMLKFHYNERDELYSAVMTGFYFAKDYADAVTFFFYMNSMLKDKYITPKAQYYGRYFQYMDLPAAIQYEHFIRNDFSLHCSYETTTTNISIALIPWSPSGTLEVRPIFVLDYKSKQIPHTYAKTNSTDLQKRLDAHGL